MMLAAALAQITVPVQGPPPAPDPCQAVSAAPGAGCPAWRSFQEDESGVLYADPGSVVPDGDGFEIRLRHVFAQADEDGGRSAIFRARFDCRRRTSAILHLALFDAAGAELFSAPTSPEQARPERAQRRTARADILDAYCPARDRSST